MVTRQAKEANARFVQRYGEVEQRIELAVIGGDSGANGYTTIAQTDQLAAVFEPIDARDRRRRRVASGHRSSSAAVAMADRAWPLFGSMSCSAA